MEIAYKILLENPRSYHLKEEKLLPIHKFGFKISTLSKNAHASSQVEV